MGRSDHTRGSNQAFALVLTLSLMVLLALLAVGLLSLSSLSLRSANSESLAAEARANARMAAQMAIGELQRLAGPDQRITASSNILDTDDQPVLRRHLTGVWRSWKWDGAGPAPDYQRRKQEDFLGWLVSTRDLLATSDREHVRSGINGTSSRLVASGSVTAPDEEVFAEVVGLAGSPFTRGSFAWAVFDEGVKARASLAESAADSFGHRLARFTSAPLPGYASVKGDAIDWSPLAGLGDDRLKIISQSQARLAGLTSASRNFHHLSAFTAGLAVNVTDGGLASDLSLLFDRATLPAPLERRFLYSGTASPLAAPPVRFDGAHQMPSPDPSWTLLHSWARLWREVRDPVATPSIAAAVDQRPDPGTSEAAILHHSHFVNPQIAPVIAKAQFVFSMGFGNHPTLSGYKANGAAAADDTYLTWLVIDPVITLWNPYNVELRVPGARIDLYRVPLSFRIFKNEDTQSGNFVHNGFTHMANTFLQEDFANRGNKFYRLNLLPRTGEDSIVLQPGEHLVFTAHGTVKHFRDGYHAVGLDMQPGWNPPAGNSSNSSVGGITTLNICVRGNGNSTGRNLGMVVRTPPVKAGDVIDVQVIPERAGIDRRTETGGDEVTAYLKYYIGGGDEQTFVGNLEFNYGDKEAELIDSYAPFTEMPRFIVPGSIPLSQGDNRVGNLPPPVVRFKEPFLIASLHLKTMGNSRWPARAWLHNQPANLSAATGIDQNEDLTFHQYEFDWEPMTGWESSPAVEISANDLGYGAGGLYRDTGQTHAVFASIPLAPPMSLGQLRHAPINFGGQLPLLTQIVGNSFASPLIAADQIRSDQGGRTYLDHSFLANQALFDRYFFSSGSGQTTAVFGADRDAGQVWADFFNGSRPLPNQRMQPYPPRDTDGATLAAALTSEPDGYQRSAAHLLILGAFNVNSTSVPAWRALLASLRPESPTAAPVTLVSRHVPPMGEPFENASTPIEEEQHLWSGHRHLDDDQIEALAEALVAEISRRGPFQSMAEFVNRRVESGTMSVTGALQAAIDAAELNAEATVLGLPTSAPPGTIHAAAANGTTADGAPAVINQADLLTPLAPLLAARSDTFVIRSYGEATRGDQSVRAWCEVVVQRLPDYLDPSEPSHQPSNGQLLESETNRTFGRRFQIISFRWLSPSEL